MVEKFEVVVNKDGKRRFGERASRSARLTLWLLLVIVAWEIIHYIVNKCAMTVIFAVYGCGRGGCLKRLVVGSTKYAQTQSEVIYEQADVVANPWNPTYWYSFTFIRHNTDDPRILPTEYITGQMAPDRLAWRTESVALRTFHQNLEQYCSRGDTNKAQRNTKPMTQWHKKKHFWKQLSSSLTSHVHSLHIIQPHQLL